VTIKEIISTKDHISRVIFSDNSELPADILIMATGVRPNKQLAEKMGLHCEKGIVVNSFMQTFDPRIYSVGECVQHRGELFGLVAPVYEQAKVCANHLAGHGVAGFKTLIAATILKVTDINLFSMGNFRGDDTTETITLQDFALNIYRKIVIRDDKIVGVVLYGDTTDSGWYMELFKKENDISEFREQLIFGKPLEAEAI
jgi:nitrite reductase (NADH) large subunit